MRGGHGPPARRFASSAHAALRGRTYHDAGKKLCEERMQQYARAAPQQRGGGPRLLLTLLLGAAVWALAWAVAPSAPGTIAAVGSAAPRAPLSAAVLAEASPIKATTVQRAAKPAAPATARRAEPRPVDVARATVARCSAALVGVSARAAGALHAERARAYLALGDAEEATLDARRVALRADADDAAAASEERESAQLLLADAERALDTERSGESARIRAACRLLGLSERCVRKYSGAKLGRIKAGLRQRWKYAGRWGRSERAYIVRTVLRLDAAWKVLRAAADATAAAPPA